MNQTNKKTYSLTPNNFTIHHFFIYFLIFHLYSKETKPEDKANRPLKWKENYNSL